MLRNLDTVQLKDVDLRCPDSLMAKQLRQRFYEMLRRNVKLGKRTLSEFRTDQLSPTYNIHPVHVPVVDDGKITPWNKQAYQEVCDAIQHASV